MRTLTAVQLLSREVSEVLLRMGEKTLPTRSLRKRRTVSDRGSRHRSLCPWNVTSSGWRIQYMVRPEKKPRAKLRRTSFAT